MASQIFYMACPPDSLPRWLCRYGGIGVVSMTPGWKGRVFGTVDCGVMVLAQLILVAQFCGYRTTQSAPEVLMCASLALSAHSPLFSAQVLTFFVFF